MDAEAEEFPGMGTWRSVVERLVEVGLSVRMAEKEEVDAEV